LKRTVLDMCISSYKQVWIASYDFFSVEIIISAHSFNPMLSLYMDNFISYSVSPLEAVDWRVDYLLVPVHWRYPVRV